MSNLTESKRRRARLSSGAARQREQETRARERAQKRTPEPIKIATDWDLLHQENAALGHAIQTPRMLAGALRDARVLATLTDTQQQHLAQDMRQIVSDADLIAGKLAGLRSSHEHLHGPAQDEYEKAEILMLSQQYKSLFTLINTVFTPTVLRVSAMLERGVREVAAQQKTTLKDLTLADPRTKSAEEAANQSSVLDCSLDALTNLNQTN